MADRRGFPEKASQSKSFSSDEGKENSKKTIKQDSKNKVSSKNQSQDVIFNLPWGLKYKVPGKRQRVIIGSLVVGLNLLLVIAVIVYFYVPSFQEFIYNVGRN